MLGNPIFRSNISKKILFVVLSIFGSFVSNPEVRANDSGSWYKAALLKAGAIDADVESFNLPPLQLDSLEIFYVSGQHESNKAFIKLPVGDRCAEVTGQPRDRWLQHSSSYWSVDLPLDGLSGLYNLQFEAYNCWFPGKPDERLLAEAYYQIALCDKGCNYADARTLGTIVIMRGGEDVTVFKEVMNAYIREITDRYKYLREEHYATQQQRRAIARLAELADWRKSLEPGAAIEDGMVIQLEPPLAFVQICSTWVVTPDGREECRNASTMWRRIEELEPPVDQ